MEDTPKKIGRPKGSKSGKIPTIKAKTAEIDFSKVACPVCKQAGTLKRTTTRAVRNGFKVSYLHCRFCQSMTKLERTVTDAGIK